MPGVVGSFSSETGSNWRVPPPETGQTSLTGSNWRVPPLETRQTSLTGPTESAGRRH